MSLHPVKDEWVKVVIIEPGPVSTQRARIVHVHDLEGCLVDLVGDDRATSPIEDELTAENPTLRHCVLHHGVNDATAAVPGVNEVARVLGARQAVGRAVLVRYPDGDGLAWDLEPGTLGQVFRIIGRYLGVVT